MTKNTSCFIAANGQRNEAGPDTLPSGPVIHVRQDMKELENQGPVNILPLDKPLKVHAVKKQRKAKRKQRVLSCWNMWRNENNKEYVCLMPLNHAGPCRPIPLGCVVFKIVR